MTRPPPHGNVCDPESGLAVPAAGPAYPCELFTSLNIGSVPRVGSWSAAACERGVALVPKETYAQLRRACGVAPFPEARPSLLPGMLKEASKFERVLRRHDTTASLEFGERYW